MVSMCGALRRVKDDPFAVLCPSVVEEVCRGQGHTWRAGPLRPAKTVALFVQQIAAGNVSCAAVRHLRGPGMPAFSAPAYCQARQRLPLAVLLELSRRMHDAATWMARQDGASFTWRGHRTWVVDGSTFSMPDTPALQSHFGQPRGQASGCGFPVAHLLAMFDLRSGLLAEPAAAPLYSSDLPHTPKMHALMPNHHKRIVDFAPARPHHRQKGPAGRPRSRWIKSLGREDQLVEWFKPAQCPRWMTPEQYEQLPGAIVVREVRRTVRRKGFRPLVVTVVTTLLDPDRYPADDLIALRMQRWTVETNLRHLKTTMGMDVLKCKTVDGVLKELAVFVLVYNLVRAVMIQAAARQGVGVERLSFADALHWLRHARPDDPLPTLLRVPHRPGRVEPRAVKRRPKPYPLMNRPREQWRRQLRQSPENQGENAFA